jgi:hypothetical protein
LQRLAIPGAVGLSGSLDLEIVQRSFAECAPFHAFRTAGQASIDNGACDLAALYLRRFVAAQQPMPAGSTDTVRLAKSPNRQNCPGLAQSVPPG